MHVNSSQQGGGGPEFSDALIEVESPDDTDSDYESTYIYSEGNKQTIDGENIEAASIYCSGSGCTGGGGGYWNLELGLIEDSGDENTAPTADDDGTIDAGICAENTTQIIDVLDNDGDDNDNSYDKSNIEITEITQEASKGTTQIFEDDDGVDKISYTPDPDTTGEVTFEYEAKFPDPEGTTDTAIVTVDVTGGCGSLTVKVEGPDGSPVSGATVEPLIGGTHVPQVTGPDGTAPYNVDISNNPVQTQMNESMIISVPDGFATSVERYEKDIEKTVTASGPKEEPDDFWYPIQERVRTKSKLATDPSGGGGGDDPVNTCTRSIQPSDWTGQTDSSSIQSDGDDDYYEDYESSDGRVTATLDVTDYVGSGETLQSVAVDYGGNADCDPQADFCTAEASTQVSFNTGKSESGAAATDSNTANDSYNGTLTTTNENVESIEATNDSSANTARKPNGPDVKATAAAAVGGTEITVETSESCSDTGGGGDSGGGDTANTAPEAFHIYPEYSGNALDQITLQGLASDVDDGTLTYSWYRGTDTSGNPDGTGQSYSLGTKSCSYSQDWTLQVSDGDLTDTVTRTIEASNGCQSGSGPGNPDQPIQVE